MSNVRSPASDMVEPSMVISSTVRVVNVPRLVILVCAAVFNVPAKSVVVNKPVEGL